MQNGLVSIITPSYNCAEYIGDTIESVIAQTYTNWEMIIADDCSTDNSLEVIHSYMEKDKRIKCYKLPHNSGAAMARNEAMKNAQGQYMAFLDSDDVWLSEKLEKQLKFMQTTGHAFTCTSYSQVDKSGGSLERIIRVKKKVNYNRLLLDCPVGNSTVMYDVSKLGKFETPNIRKRNDDALWLKMLKKEEYIWGLDEVLVNYRIRPNSISINKFSLVKYHWILYRDIEHLSVFRSVFHICYWGFLKVFRIK